jgi:hypothetical protein
MKVFQRNSFSKGDGLKPFKAQKNYDSTKSFLYYSHADAVVATSSAAGLAVAAVSPGNKFGANHATKIRDHVFAGRRDVTLRHLVWPPCDAYDYG